MAKLGCLLTLLPLCLFIVFCFLAFVYSMLFGESAWQ